MCTWSARTGPASAPIVIRAYGRERVTIDGVEPMGHSPATSRTSGSGGTRSGSWRPRTTLTLTRRSTSRCGLSRRQTSAQFLRHGAFMDREPYTRLITYSRLEDLRAVNQTFGRLPLNDPLPPFPGFPVVDEDDIPVKVNQPDGTS